MRTLNPEKLQNFCDKLTITDIGTGNHPKYNCYLDYKGYNFYAEIKYNQDNDCEFNVCKACDDVITTNSIYNKVYDLDVCEESLKTCIYDFIIEFYYKRTIK